MRATSIRGRTPEIVTRSPILTAVEGLTGAPLMRTCPALTPDVARERLLKIRTDHSHTSMRVLLASLIAPG